MVSCLIFVYENQQAWVNWGSCESSSFQILNGTRQGSVLSPSIFGIYLDDLLKKLRDSGVGCHIGGIFFGAASFADDLALIAPCRSAMQRMIDICEAYGRGVEHLGF